jgi:hypothetical protein
LRGAEGNGRQLSAARAGGLSLDLRVGVILALRRRRSEHGDALGFAGLAAFGFVLELLIVKEKLFPGGENKITPTVDALQYLVLKFHLRMAPFSPSSSRSPCGERNAGGTKRYRLSYIPLTCCPLDSARHAPGRHVDTAQHIPCLYAGERFMSMKFPAATRLGWGPDRAEPPREGAALSC